jgi:membrane protease YdiL (CAAX protease family)
LGYNFYEAKVTLLTSLIYQYLIVSIYGEVKIRLAFPTLLYSMLEFVTFAVGVSIVFLLSKALAIRPKSIAIAEPKKEATLAIIVYVVLFVMAFAWFALSSMFHLQPFRFPFDITQAWVLVLLEGTSLLIIIVAMKSTRQKLGMIGVNKTDMGKMIALGAILGVIYLAVTGLLVPYAGGGFAGLSSSLAFALVFSAIVGFSEETVWRGYIQTRLTAYGGSISGLVATSLIFACAHFPTSYYYQTPGDVLASLAWVLVRVPVSLLLGYIMLKSQNIIPSSIFHVFVDWSIYLWQIS